MTDLIAVLSLLAYGFQVFLQFKISFPKKNDFSTPRYSHDNQLYFFLITVNFLVSSLGRSYCLTPLRSHVDVDVTLDFSSNNFQNSTGEYFEMRTFLLIKVKY